MKSKLLLTEKERLKRKNEFDGNLVCGSKKFHCNTGRNKIVYAPTAELLKIVEEVIPGVYQRQENLFTPIDICPLCSSSNHVFLLNRMGISLHRCNDCGFGFQNPKIKKEILKELYKTEETAYNVYLQSSQLSIDIKKFDYGLDLIDSFSPSSKDSIMDIGCGSGLSLERAIAKGWKRCVGIEPHKLYEFSKDARIEILNKPFEDSLKNLDKKLNAIMIWDVLEHIYEPFHFLNSVKKVMNSDALILIMVPNLESLASRLIRERSPTFNWSHLNYFAPTSIRRFLSEGGFKIELLETVISEIGNVNNYLAFDDPYMGDNEKTITLEFLTPEYIHNHLLGSRLLVIARNI